MSGSNLRASLEFSLIDEITAPLRQLRDLLEDLGAIAKGLDFSALGKALRELRGIGGDMGSLKSGLDGVAQGADSATSSLNRMKRAALDVNAIRVDSGGIAMPPSAGALVPLRGQGVASYSGALVPAGIPLGGPFGESGAAVAAGAVAGGRLNGMDALVSGAAVIEPLRQFAEYDKLLRQIAITENVKGAAVGPELRRLTKLFNAEALFTGQSSMSIAEAKLDLLKQGVPSSEAEKALHFHSMAATAYNVPASDLGQVTGALINNMKLSPGDLGGALAALAVAAKSGRFNVADFAHEIQNITGPFAAAGYSGRKGLDEILAMMEIVMKNVGLPSSAAADSVQTLGQLFSPWTDKRAANTLGVDLSHFLHDEELRGVHSLPAYVDLLVGKTRGMSPVQMMNYLGHTMRSGEARQVLIAMIEHEKEMLALQARLDQVQGSQLFSDFGTASASGQVKIDRAAERGTQISRVLGERWMPVLDVANGLLEGLLKRLNALHDSPIGRWVLTLGGEFLALMAAVGAVGFVVRVVAAGFETLRIAQLVIGVASLSAAIVALNPLMIGAAIAVAAFAGVAFLVYRNWGPLKAWFHGLIEGIKGDWSELEKWFDQSWLGRELGLGGMPQLAAIHNAAGMGAGSGAVNGRIDVHVHGSGASVSAASNTPGMTMPVHVGNTTRRP